MPARSPSLDAMTIAAPNAATLAPTIQKTASPLLFPVRVMKRAIFSDMAERLRCRAIGVRARAAKERRNALMVEAFSFIIARAPLTDRAGVPHAGPVPEPWQIGRAHV